MAKITPMALPILDVHSVVFAIVEETTDDEAPRFLGTGFFFGNDGQFLTAGHNLKARTDGSKLLAVRVPSKPGEGLRKSEIGEFAFDSEIDVAVGLVLDAKLSRGLSLSDSGVALDEDLLLPEFARSTKRDPRRANLELGEPEFFRGYVIRAITSDWPGWPRAATCYELSVPALLGASGAPVISLSSHLVVGMVVANIAHELLPAHLERIERPDGTTEEMRFYLPNALALVDDELTAAMARLSEA